MTEVQQESDVVKYWRPFETKSARQNHLTQGKRKKRSNGYKDVQETSKGKVKDGSKKRFNKHNKQQDEKDNERFNRLMPKILLDVQHKDHLQFSDFLNERKKRREYYLVKYEKEFRETKDDLMKIVHNRLKNRESAQNCRQDVRIEYLRGELEIAQDLRRDEERENGRLKEEYDWIRKKVDNLFEEVRQEISSGRFT